MEIDGLSDCNYWWHAGGGRGGGVRGAAPLWSGAKPRPGVRGAEPRLLRNELKMFHEQILS